ncbi:MAG TPA: AgmX/PglI C-terminal domain-containing protein [Polyangiaceae bacterium]
MAHEYLGSQSPTVPSFVPVIDVPYFHGEDTPTHVAPATSDIEPQYVLVRSAAPVSPEECEEPGATAIEVTVLWGANVLHVSHLSPPRSFSVGHGEGEPVDFVVPAELAPFSRAELVVVEGGVARVIAPRGADLEAVSGRLVVDALDGVGGRSATLADGAVADVRFGALSFRVSCVAAGKRMPRYVGGDAGGLGSSFLATFAAVATVLGTLAYYTPALGSTLDDELDRDRLAVMLSILKTNADREDEQKPTDGNTQAPQGGGTPGTAAKGVEGKMGRPDKPSTHGRFGIQGQGEVVLSKQQLIAEARTFGFIGMLNTMNSRSVPQALWGADVPNGPDDKDAMGEIFGEDIHESGGVGGLGLTGIGEGGGGHGEQIGLTGIGTCGTNCGMGPGKWGIGPGKDGWGTGVGGTRDGHKTKVPIMRPGTTVVNGHIPSEVIQRIVRQNYGRFRSCYEIGLRTNPNLTGRVTARFVIGRDGAVSNVTNGGGDLPDSTVTSCVMSAFYGLSFPAPDGGIVTVTYPIMLVPG